MNHFTPYNKIQFKHKIYDSDVKCMPQSPLSPQNITLLKVSAIYEMKSITISRAAENEQLNSKDK